VEQRWLVVESQERGKTDLKQLSKQLDKQQKMQQSALQKLCRQEFNCEADAREATQRLATKMKYVKNIIFSIKAFLQHKRE
jgi:transposase